MKKWRGKRDKYSNYCVKPKISEFRVHLFLAFKLLNKIILNIVILMRNFDFAIKVTQYKIKIGNLSNVILSWYLFFIYLINQEIV